MTENRSKDRSLLLLGACLLGVVLALFHEGLKPGKILFSFDNSLGAQSQAALRLPKAFTGVWYDLNTIGMNGGTTNVDISNLFAWLIGPLAYAKWYVPCVVLFLGLSAGLFFRLLRLGP